jgi:ATP/ADP translocase
MTKEEFLAIVRHCLTFLSGIVVSKGWFDAGTVAEVVAAVTGIAMVGWSVWQKKHQQKVVEVALAMPATTTPERLAEVVANTP